VKDTLLEMGVTSLQVVTNCPTFFTVLPLPCITVNANQRAKKNGMGLPAQWCKSCVDTLHGSWTKAVLPNSTW